MTFSFVELEGLLELVWTGLPLGPRAHRSLFSLL